MAPAELTPDEEMALHAVARVTYGQGNLWATTWDVALGHRIDWENGERRPSEDSQARAARCLYRLYDLGLVYGCVCGCRGGWTLTVAGAEWLGLPAVDPAWQ